MKSSLLSFKVIGKTKKTRLNQSFNFSPTNVLLKETFRGGLVISTLATAAPFLLTILYKAGYFNFKDS